MEAPQAPDAADQRLPWWLRRHVGWALLLVLAAVVLDTTLQVVTVEAAHDAATLAGADRREPAVPVSATAVPSSDRSTGDDRNRWAPRVEGGERRTRLLALRPVDRAAGPSRWESRVSDERREQRATKARLAEQREAERVARVSLRRELRADRQLAALLSTLAEAPEGWVSPVDGAYRITATFGAHGSMWSNTHTGVDLAAPTGTPVRAVAAGTVIFAAENGAYGLRVAVRHEDGTETWYAHLSRMSVTTGQEVPQGAPIGAIGATGNVTGPHLHLELRPGGGDPVDPVGGLRSRGAVL